LKTRKKEKLWKSKNFYIDLHLIDGFGMEFTAWEVELMPEGALTSFTVRDAYRYFVGQS